VALGYEHSIANFCLIPLGIPLGAEGGLARIAQNLVSVTLGNVVGGRALFAFIAASLGAFVVFVLMRLGTHPSGASERTRGLFVSFPSTSQAVYRLFPHGNRQTRPATAQ
jgi:hypothetical protein